MQTYCGFIKPHPPRSAWTFYGPIKLKRGKLSDKLTYNNLVSGAQDQPNDFEIDFTWSGKLVGSKLMRLQLKGRVTKAGSDPTVQKCKDVAFTDTPRAAHRSLVGRRPGATPARRGYHSSSTP